MEVLLQSKLKQLYPALSGLRIQSQKSNITLYSHPTRYPDDSPNVISPIVDSLNGAARNKTELVLPFGRLTFGEYYIR